MQGGPPPNQQQGYTPQTSAENVQQQYRQGY
jgi:hypothetical protein